MRPHILVGTHQKTGTVWMDDVFKGIARALNTAYVNTSRLDDAAFARRHRARLAAAKKPAILFDNHSAFPASCLALEHRGFRLIRDPRDMVISAVRYHETTDAAFANAPKQDLGGASIREHVSRLPDLEAKLRFEIGHAMRGNILDLERQAARAPSLKAVKYEQLIEDAGLELTPRLLGHLGLAGHELVVATCIFWEGSLFGLKRPGGSGHIRNGAAGQFRKVYSADLVAHFERAYPGLIARLGYDAAPVADPEIRAFAPPAAVLAAREALTAAPDAAGVETALEAAAAHLDRPARLYIAYARFLLGAGEARRAEACAWRALERDETDPAASIVLGDVCRARDDARGAEQAYRTALALAPRSTAAAQRLKALHPEAAPC